MYYVSLGDKYTNTLLFSESYASYPDAYIRHLGFSCEARARIWSGIQHRYVVYFGQSAPSLPGSDTSFVAADSGGAFTVHWTDAGGAHQETLGSENFYWQRLAQLKWTRDTTNGTEVWNVYGDFSRHDALMNNPIQGAIW